MTRVRKEEKEAARQRLAALEKVTKRFDHWRPAGQVLGHVRAQPTIFVQLDRATRVGGWPLQRLGLIHGPSNQGKSCLALGLGLSFLRAGHVFGYIDAEHTTPEDWLTKLMAEHAANPGFVAMRPVDYEDAVAGVRELVEHVAQSRARGELPEETSALIVVDSIRKLTPKKLLDKILKGDNGIDGAKGRAAMMKAALNAQWLDELTPTMYHSNCSMVFVSRESENPDAGLFEIDYKVQGGRALVYDSSLVCRVTRASWVKKGDDVIGERNRVRILKTKIGGKETKAEEAYFYTSNGVFLPEGFDHARALLEEAIAQGVVEAKGNSYSFNGERLGQVNGAVKVLHDNDELSVQIESAVREAFSRA